MSTVREYSGPASARISTTSPYIRVKAIPGLNLPALHRVHSAGAASVSSTNLSCTPSEKEEHQHIPPEEPCFITKRPGYGLQKTHLVNAVRKRPTDKEAIQAFLGSLSVVELGFNLNSASNLVPLDRELHDVLDKLGFFAVTCAKPTLKAILTLLQQQNQIFDGREYRKYPRFFDLDKEPFSTAQYELVILHPDHFRPSGSTLAIHTPSSNPTMRVDGALRQGRANNTPRFPAFQPSSREKQHYCRSSFPALCADYQELVDLTIAVADEIYYAPVVEKAMRTAFGSKGLLETSDKDETLTTEGQLEGGRKKYTVSVTSRFGPEVKIPGADASQEEMSDYCRYLLSGRDEPLTRRDKAILKSTGLYSVENNANEGGEDYDAFDSDEYEEA
ncbi:hypothetical protein CPB84DRAFT_1771822 [Gymnopilus junonius]|uniref:Uncharacterized protein n=1 Tax=Gymnopilus junonius TaxID=109634 RepID=A0A9P5NQH6_GYMJU|nr:hypothetical protein CPB84DRAFT_1771822 [Gymnopilus junonius]